MAEVKMKKRQIENLDPDKIIQDILNTKRNKKENQITKDQLIESLKKNSVNIFIDNLKNRSVKDITQFYNGKIEEFNKASQLYCDKKKKEK